MVKSGDVVIVSFPGARGVKRRPAVVLSSATYHRTRPDVILGLVTSQVVNANDPSDHVLVHWQQANLRKPSAFRAYLMTMPEASVEVVGHLSDEDRRAVQQCLVEALDLRFE